MYGPGVAAWQRYLLGVHIVGCSAITPLIVRTVDIYPMHSHKTLIVTEFSFDFNSARNFRWSGSMPEWTVGAKVHEGTGHRIIRDFRRDVPFVFRHRARDQRFGSPVPPAGKSLFLRARNRLQSRDRFFYSLFHGCGNQKSVAGFHRFGTGLPARTKFRRSPRSFQPVRRPQTPR
jgi:hypothetical protein